MPLHQSRERGRERAGRPYGGGRCGGLRGLGSSRGKTKINSQAHRRPPCPLVAMIKQERRARRRAGRGHPRDEARRESLAAGGWAKRPDRRRSLRSHNSPKNGHTNPHLQPEAGRFSPHLRSIGRPYFPTRGRTRLTAVRERGRGRMQPRQGARSGESRSMIHTNRHPGPDTARVAHQAAVERAGEKCAPLPHHC